MLELPPNDMDPFNWVYREDNVDLDPSESGFSVTPLMGNTLDMPTVLVLDLSGSITANGVLGTLKTAANTIIDAMLPEQRLAIMTFADTATVRVPFTTDKTMLKSAVSALSMGDGVSTNLYGAMIQAFGMWQDGFAGGVASANAKLTAGLAIVITDGNDDAGVKTLNDVLTAGKNKRVISVGVGGTQMNASALRQMATTGTYVPVTSYQTLANDVGKVTSAMQTLGKSIYTANYCSPKRAGTHELMFSVKGNGDSTAATTCTPATFPASQPGMCANLGPTFTQACGFTKGPTTYTCCQADTPFTCPNDSFCYPTAEAAAAKCGSSMAGSSGCIRCGGTGMGATQDTQLQPGPAIHVRFNAATYSSGQCPKFWGPNCKTLQDCCTNKAPASQMANCNSQLTSAQGNEATCQSDIMTFCPTLGPQCMALGTCCGTYPAGSSVQQTCQNTLFNARGMETLCTTATNQYCPTGTNCSMLKTCCSGFGTSVQQNCYSLLTSANGSEGECMSNMSSYCPTSPNCQKLKACCASKTMNARDNCEQELVGSSNDDATCQSYLTTNQCP
jgi:Mg-chelatase subunit ChlD